MGIKRTIKVRMGTIIYVLSLLTVFGNSPYFVKGALPSSVRNETIIELCNESSINGDINRIPFIAELCSGIINTRETPPLQVCKPLPPRPKKAKIENLNKLLAEGIELMQNPLTQNSQSTQSNIFVFGVTGSGKTTVTQILAGNLETLHATKTRAGSLVIIDDNNRIGEPSTMSKTLVPEFVVYPKTGVTFWDCPGFDDSRGPIVDISAMYFIKYAMDRTKEAKFLFTTSKSSVTQGDNRLEFNLLGTHAVKILKNVSKFEDSIGLIVTKVGSRSIYTGKYLSDDEIMTRILGFLNKYLVTINEQLESTTNAMERLRLQSKIKFVQGIIRKEGSSRRLFFLRSPTECGVLSEMPAILDTRNKLTNLYTSALNYTTVSPAGFQYTLKDETRLKIVETYKPEKIQQIAEISRQIAIDLTTQFQNKFYADLFQNNVQSLQVLNKTDDVLKLVLTDTAPNHTYFSSQIIQIYNSTGFEMNCTTGKIMQLLEGQLQFFEEVSSQSNSSQIIEPTWKLPYVEFLTKLNEQKEFYEFCSTTESILAKNQTQYFLTKLAENIFVTIDSNNVLEFLQRHKLVTVSNRIWLLWSRMNYEDKNYLSQMVHSMMPASNFNVTSCLELTGFKSELCPFPPSSNISMVNAPESSLIGGWTISEILTHFLTLFGV